MTKLKDNKFTSLGNYNSPQTIIGHNIWNMLRISLSLILYLFSVPAPRINVEYGVLLTIFITIVTSDIVDIRDSANFSLIIHDFMAIYTQN